MRFIEKYAVVVGTSWFPLYGRVATQERICTASDEDEHFTRWDRPANGGTST